MIEKSANSGTALSEAAGNSIASNDLFIGADIGGTNLRLALADIDGTILARWSCSTAGIRDPAVVVQFIKDGIAALLEQTSATRTSLRMIGAGAPGLTDTDHGIVIATSYLMGWRDVPLKAMLEASLGISAVIDNDVNLAALGEHRAGSAQHVSDFVFIAIGTGVGAGIVVGDRLLRGSGWSAGEIGYMLVPGTSEAPAGHGEPGALESLVGGQGIREHWQKLWNETETSLPQQASATEIFDEALTGGILAQKILEQSSRTLAYAIYNVSLVLNCPLFLLGGGVGTHPAFIAATQSVLDQRSTRQHLRITRACLAEDAQLVGSIFLAIEAFKRKAAK